MAVLFFGLSLVFAFVFSPSANALPFSVKEDGFVFPVSSLYFPDQYRNISFNGNKNLILEKGISRFNAFFAIPLNESNLAHEIYFIPNNQSPNTGRYNAFQTLWLFSTFRSDFRWSNWNDTNDLRNYNTFCDNHTGMHTVESHPKNLKIQFYTNGTVIYDNTNICDMPIQNNFTYGKYFYIPFSISWIHIFQSFTLKMENGIKLAFYEGQYQNPPKMMGWPLLELSTTTATTTTTIPTTTSMSTTTASTTTITIIFLMLNIFLCFKSK